MSEIRATTISDAAGTGPITLTKQSAAKAWVNANGGIAIRDSLNVSSMTDISNGVHTFSFANNMSAAETYGITGAGNSGVVNIWGSLNLANGFRTYVTDYSGTATDQGFIMYSIDGDLA